MRRLIIFLISAIVASFSNCYSQDLLSVDWQEVVCASNYISHVHSVCNDNEGNSFTLGSFNREADCLEEYVNDSLGAYFITKQNSNGDKLFAKNLGGSNNFTFGDIKVRSNGDLIFGLSFKSTFFLGGDSITHSLTWSSIILILDQNFNLKWFKTFPATHNTYIKHLVLDKDENIYTSIQFVDSLSINGDLFSQSTGYGTVIAKLDSEGDILWTHHYNSEKTLTNQVLRVKKSCDSCTETLYVSGNVKGDSIFIDGMLKAQHSSKFNNQFFVSTLNESGKILTTKFLQEGIRSIANIDFYENRIFIAGTYIDTVFWSNTYVTPEDYSSIYIGELNELSDIIGFADLQCSKTTYLTGFNISPLYGFLISGHFDGSFVLQSSSMNLMSKYNRGSFIASIDESLKLNDCRFIEGGLYNLRFQSMSNNQITGSAVFEQTCNFQNQSCFAWRQDVSTFQTTDINQLVSFKPKPFPLPQIPVPFSVKVFPNPFRTTFHMKFSKPVNSVSIIMTNVIGQVCQDIEISQIDDTEIIIDARGLSTGVYNVQYATSINNTETIKLMKVN